MQKNSVNAFQKKRMKDMIFCLCIIAVPAVQFCIFYVGVNFNSILMAFQKVDIVNNRYVYKMAGLENFETMWFELKHGFELPYAIKNSFIAFIVTVGVGTTLALFFSLYIFKGMAFSKTFRIILFAPSMISAIVTVKMYEGFVETAFPAIFDSLDGSGLLSNLDTQFPTLLFFMVWVGFGTQILMYSGAMNSIDTSIIEAAKLDGANALREFVSIILPLIYPTITTFLVVNLAGFFTNQMHLFSFYANGADPTVSTIGYMLFKRTRKGGIMEYPLLAAYSIAFTLIAAPVTMLGRKFLEKVGPKLE
ncbi:MAG: sugar ABC transporter permease [Clostridia bacterium]|nr:sugar ABC transporter permease [Clostridia bacterium]